MNLLFFFFLLNLLIRLSLSFIIFNLFDIYQIIMKRVYFRFLLQIFIFYYKIILLLLFIDINFYFCSLLILTLSINYLIFFRLVKLLLCFIKLFFLYIKVIFIIYFKNNILINIIS